MTELVDRFIDELLTKYVDQLNEGKNPDINIFLDQCPIESREELKNLMESSKLIRDTFNPPEAITRSLQGTLKAVAAISYKQPQKFKQVVNYRKKEELTPEEEKKAQDAIDAIFKQIEEEKE